MLLIAQAPSPSPGDCPRRQPCGNPVVAICRRYSICAHDGLSGAIPADHRERHCRSRPRCTAGRGRKDPRSPPMAVRRPDRRSRRRDRVCADCRDGQSASRCWGARALHRIRDRRVVVLSRVPADGQRHHDHLAVARRHIGRHHGRICAVVHSVARRRGARYLPPRSRGRLRLVLCGEHRSATPVVPHAGARGGTSNRLWRERGSACLRRILSGGSSRASGVRTRDRHVLVALQRHPARLGKCGPHNPLERGAAHAAAAAVP